MLPDLVHYDQTTFALVPVRFMHILETKINASDKIKGLESSSVRKKIHFFVSEVGYLALVQNGGPETT